MPSRLTSDIDLDYLNQHWHYGTDNQIHNKMWNVMIYPCPNLRGDFVKKGSWEVIQVEKISHPRGLVVDVGSPSLLDEQGIGRARWDNILQVGVV